MTTAKLFANGHELHIDKRIGKGGEGEVFAVSNMPGFAVKAYLPGLVAEREKKIRAMVGARLADSAPMVAFQYQVVVDGRGAFVGFVMRVGVMGVGRLAVRVVRFLVLVGGFVVRGGCWMFGQSSTPVNCPEAVWMASERRPVHRPADRARPAP